jgi:hypothetical protein
MLLNLRRYRAAIVSADQNSLEGKSALPILWLIAPLEYALNALKLLMVNQRSVRSLI